MCSATSQLLQEKIALENQLHEQVKLIVEVYEGLENQIAKKYAENILFSLAKPQGENTLTLDLDDINNL